MNSAIRNVDITALLGYLQDAIHGSVSNTIVHDAGLRPDTLRTFKPDFNKRDGSEMSWLHRIERYAGVGIEDAFREAILKVISSKGVLKETVRIRNRFVRHKLGRYTQEEKEGEYKNYVREPRQVIDIAKNHVEALARAHAREDFQAALMKAKTPFEKSA